MRPVVHEVADRAEIAGGGESSFGDDQHVRTEPLDLVEDVAGDEHAPVGLTEPVEQVDQVSALARIEAGERLVQHEDVGVVHQGRRHLDPLAHAFGIGGDAASVVGVQLDHVERGARRPSGRRAREGSRRGARTPVACARRTWSPAGGPGRFGPGPPRRRGVAAVDAHGALRGRGQPAQQPEQRRLPGAVRAEHRGHPGAHRERHLRDRDDAAEPLGGPLDGHRRVRVGRRRREQGGVRRRSRHGWWRGRRRRGVGHRVTRRSR